MEDRLYKFARLVDAGSYTNAAKQMHISQPALTSAVQKLERELHAELLIRSGREFKLTAAGSIAYETAKQITIETENLKQRLADAEGHKPTLRLGMIDSLADMLFVHNNALKNLEQKTKLSLVIDNSGRLIRQIERDELDVVLVANPATLPSAIMSINLGSEPLVLVTHQSKAAAVQHEVEQGHIQNFLGYNQHSHTHQLIDQSLAAVGISLDHRFYSTSPSLLLELVLAKRGSAVLPYLLVKHYLDKGTLVAIAAGESSIIARNIVSLHRGGKLLPAEANTLLAQAQAQLTKQMLQAKRIDASQD
jgi:DNA-binding transcriptional LysR family regulator